MKSTTKSTITRTLLTFAAGAACATVIAGAYENRVFTPEEWGEVADQTLVTVSELGGQVVRAENGIVWVHTSSVDACMVPPPKPKQPDPRTLELGFKALRELYKAKLVGNPEAIRLTDRCQTY